MIVESGHYALVLALALALIQSTLPILGARWRDPTLMNVARSTALAQLLFVAFSFAALVALLAPKGELNLNFGDDIISAVCVTADGDIRHAPTRQRLGMSKPETSTVESAR